MKGWGGRPFSGKRVGGYPLFQPGKKILTFLVIVGTVWHGRCFNTQNRSKQPVGVVLKCFKLLKAFFSNFAKILPILVDFLLNKRIFERVGGTTFLVERVGAPLYSDLRSTMAMQQK
jgi:hypothetical protein